MPLVPWVAAFVVLSQEPTSLDGLLERVKAALPGEPSSIAVYLEADAAVMEMVRRGALKTGDEFRKASGLVMYSGNTFPRTQTKYELLLTAVALGDVEARKSLGEAWDLLMVGMSRDRRIGVVKADPGSERWRVRPTAKSILAVYRDPVKAAEAGKSAKDNPEVKAIVDADQKARDRDWSKLTMKDYEQIALEDKKRLRRIKQILAAGGVRTSNDFDNAGLVCQHGETFEDYALAHEMSVSSMMLGKTSASWLAGASYDRMLVNCGLPQRFATQYSILNGETKITRYDTEGINDTERKAVVGRTLREAVERKF